MSKGFIDKASEIEDSLIDLLEQITDEPEGGYSDTELQKLINKAGAASKLCDSVVALNTLKCNVVSLAAKTKGLYNDTLGIKQAPKTKELEYDSFEV